MLARWFCLSFIIASLSQYDALPNSPSRPATIEATKDAAYLSYLKCLALCVKWHTSEINATLLSGETVVNRAKNGHEFESCDGFCQEKEDYKIAPRGGRLNALEATEFDPLEITCIERVAFSPLQIRAKLFIHRKAPLARTAKLLHVVETWSSLASENGSLNHTLVARDFTFSDRPMISYTFAHANNRDTLHIRVFSFTSSGLFGTPLCSGPIYPKPLLDFHQKSVNLSLMKASSANKSALFLKWSPLDTRSLPECDQAVQLITPNGTVTKWVNLDSSHVIPIGTLNSSAIVKVVGLRIYESNVETDSASVLLIPSTYEEQEDSFLANNIGLILLAIILLGLFILAIIITLCILHCRKTPQQKVPSARQVNIFHPHRVRDETRTEAGREYATPSYLASVSTVFYDKTPHPSNRYNQLVEDCLGPVATNDSSFNTEFADKTPKRNGRFAIRTNTSTPILNPRFNPQIPIEPPIEGDLV